MNNRQMAGLFFGLGFLVIVAGIFMTTQNSTNNGNTGLRPQTVNRGIGNITPNAVNENANNGNNSNYFNTEKCNKIKTDLDKVSGVDNVDAVIADNAAVINCTVTDELKKDTNFKNTLINKVKEIEPSLTNVYIMDNTDKMYSDFTNISSQISGGKISNAKADWDNMWKKITSGNM